jgi:hypothetical protein
MHNPSMSIHLFKLFEQRHPLKSVNGRETLMLLNIIDKYQGF